LLAQGRWFSPGTTASSTTNTGRHDIAEILLKVALNTKIQIQIHTTEEAFCHEDILCTMHYSNLLVLFGDWLTDVIL
jgi:hypothetical protein